MEERRARIDYATLPIGRHVPRVVNAVVEIPSGQANKYEYDNGLHVFRLDRPLYASVVYPIQYGFIPSTLGQDGDTLDILVLAPHPTFTGCVIEVRPVGSLRVVDRGVRDEKILAAVAASPFHRGIRNYTDVPAHTRREIEHFFTVYKQLEGKRTQMLGWRNARQAQALIRDSHRRFEGKTGAPART